MATQDSIGSVLGPQAMQTNSSVQGLDQGIQLAQTAQDMQEKQQKQQQMTEQLTDMKFKNYMGTQQTALQMSEPVFKASEDLLDKRMAKIVPGYQPGSLKAMRADPDLKASIQNFHSAVATGEIPTTPELQDQVLKTGSDLGTQADVVNAWNEQRKLKSAQAIKEAANANAQTIANTKAATAEKVADIGAQGRVAAASVSAGPGSPRVVRTQEAVNNDYERAIKPYEQTVNAVDQLKSTLADIDSGKLSDAKNVKAEIESKMASVFGGGRPSTVFGTQAVGLDSLYGEYQNMMNKTLGEAKGVLTDAQKAQIHQELQTFGSNAAKQHEDAYLKFSAGHENLPEQYTAGVHKNYSSYRQQKGLPDVNTGGQVQAPAANSAAAGQTAPAPQMNVKQKAAYDAMVQAGIDPMKAQKKVMGQ